MKEKIWDIFNIDANMANRRGTTLINLNARDKINKLETVPFEIQNELITEVLENSEFEFERERLGWNLSIFGEAIILVLPYKTTYIVKTLKVVDYKRIGKFNIMLEGISGATFNHDGKDHLITTKLHFVENKPTLSKYITVKNEEITVEEDWVFNTKELPGEIFFNNHEKASDIQYAGLLNAIKELNYYDSNMKPEWNRTRTTPTYNLNFTDLNPSADTKEIDEGRGYDADDAFENKYGQGKVVLPATIGTQILQQQIIFVEDEIKVKLGMNRDTLNSGSNQHNLEIIMANQFGVETLLKQQMLREKNWNSFFEKLAEVLKTEAPKVEVRLAKVEEAKMELLDATILGEKAKANGSLGNHGKPETPAPEAEKPEEA